MQKINKHSIFQTLEKYDLEKLSTKQVELIEIAQKYSFYKNRCISWYLKPFYKLVCFLSSFIAEREASYAKKIRYQQY